MSDVLVKMNPAVRDAWYAALRSDEYAQGFGFLSQHVPGHRRRFCCLGVLCELALRAGVTMVLSERSLIDGSRGTRCAYDGYDQQLPPAVLSWAGVAVPYPAVSYVGGEVSLSDLNDTYRLSFPVIATLIWDQL